jgi:hypothetical protein
VQRKRKSDPGHENSYRVFFHRKHRKKESKKILKKRIWERGKTMIGSHSNRHLPCIQAGMDGKRSQHTKKNASRN